MPDRDAFDFLEFMFDPGDLITVRPTEIWIEGGKKKSRVFDKEYRTFSRDDLETELSRHLAFCNNNNANVFFGVCPRFGRKEKRTSYEKRWQIRKANFFWLDVDDVTPEDAMQRIADAGVPEPSVVVATGNGVHFYWRLADSIRFVQNDPPAVEEAPINGKRNVFYTDEEGIRQYYWNEGDKLECVQTPPLCEEALMVEDINSGLGSLLQGDNTNDVSRILRLPGTFNCKDARNGAEKKPCGIYQFSKKTYTVDDFAGILEISPSRKRREAMKSIHLPPCDKRVLDKHQKTLAELKTACELEEEDQSGKDFELLKWAVSQRISPEALWAEVQGISKFGRRGRQYFDTSYTNAVAKVKSDRYEADYEKKDKRPMPGDKPNPDSFNEGSPQAYAAKYMLDARLHKNDGEWFIWRKDRWVGHNDRDGQIEDVTRWFVTTYPKVDVKRSDMADVLNAAKSMASKVSGGGSWYWLGKPEVDWDLRKCCVTPTKIVHLPDGKSHPLSHNFFWASSLAIEFDPDATDFEWWDEMLDSIWFPFSDDVDCQRTLQEWFGYCLTADTSQQKILALIGPPRSGKGTIVKVLTELLGVGNVASVKAQTLADAHGTQGLLNKPLAVMGDARFSRKDEQDVVEALLSISGEDAQWVNPKHSAAFSTTLPTRIMLVSNELPPLRDASGALMNRFIILRQTVSFLGQEDTKLMTKLRNELPAILNWAIEGWRRLNARGKFNEPDNAQLLRATLEETASPMKQFVDTECVVDPNGRIVKDELFAAFKMYLMNQSRDFMPTVESFGRQLIAAVPTLGLKQHATKAELEELNAKRREEGREELTGRQKVYTGIRLKEDSDVFEWHPDEPNQFF